MKSKVLKLLVPLAILLAASAGVSAQQSFRYKADLQQITKAGFYRLTLSPDVVAKSQHGLADIRIIDQDKRFVPYVKRRSTQLKQENFLSFPIMVNTQQNDSVSSLVVENAKALLLRSLRLRLKNSAVSRRADLLGSDDKHQWFALKEEILLQPAPGSDGNSYIQSLSFPATNYRYLKLNIHNGKKAPLQVLEAGIYQDHTIGQSFQLLAAPQISRTDSSNKSTYLNLRFAQPYQVDKISFQVNLPRYFQRSVRVYSIGGNGRTLLSEHIISSDSIRPLKFSSKSSQLQLEILNGDNPPLQIDTLQAWQLKSFLIAYLEPGKSYQLLFGDKEATEPSYDLESFSGSVSWHVVDIKHGEATGNPLFKAQEGAKKEKTVYIWISIAVALALLVYMSWRMMGEMKGRG